MVPIGVTQNIRFFLLRYLYTAISTIYTDKIKYAMNIVR